MSKKALVIVESPSKAKTIQKYLGRNYSVKASVGHIKDLPKSKLGVDPKKGLAGLEKVLGLKSPPRVIEGVDIAHLAGNETVAVTRSSVASMMERLALPLLETHSVLVAGNRTIPRGRVPTLTEAIHFLVARSTATIRPPVWSTR